MSIRVVGVFRELVGGANPDLPRAKDLVGQLSQEQVGRVVEYLSEGQPLVDVMQANLDPIDGRTRIPGGPSLETDGRWVWRNDLRYFVQKYRLGLPAEFLVAVAARRRLSASERLQLAARSREFEDAYRAVIFPSSRAK